MRTGRPTFQLDADRLRRVREEAKLTQAALARRAHQLLNKPEATADTATKHYQKIERTGRTSCSFSGRCSRRSRVWRQEVCARQRSGAG